MNSLEIRKNTEPHSNALKWDFNSIDEAIRIARLIHEKFESEYQVYMDEFGKAYNVVYVNVWEEKVNSTHYEELIKFIEDEINK